ncbi:ATP-binding protein [Acetobacterium sp.]|uniref:AAA family ATPase n=1 Tax=Acetobacterium sp. TaxID=1872094 RepID=UPI002F4049C2
MLVQFSFKNFGPFREEAIFDMRGIKAYKEHDYNLINIKDYGNILKVAAIYGANASGKSNFVDAYRCFRRLVGYSFNNKDDNKESILEKYYHPFLFSGDDCDLTSEFEGVYLMDGSEYKYGFIYNHKEILYEWLYKKKISTGRKTTIIERTNLKINLGASVKKSCEKYVEQVENDVLALSFYNRLQLRTTVFKETFNCITDILALSLNCNSSIEKFSNDYFKNDFDEKKKDRLLNFLSSIDIGIKDITVEKMKDKIQVFTHHIGENGEDYEVPIDIESDGTRKVIAVYSFVEIAIRQNKGLIIDELNMQLHPLLLKYIVDLFYEENTRGQLIYTTHDTTLLDKRYFRRDQVWFINKDKKSQASISSLAEFKVRNDASFEQEYLGGVFGGIPILTDYSFEDKKNGK